MKSEFPETKLGKFGKKFGWIFSPILFIVLLAYTLLTAQNLSFDPFNGDITKYGNVHVKEVSDSDVYFDGSLVGKTSTVLKTSKVSQTQSLQVDVKKDGRRTWTKLVKPREGYVSILYPILYPQEIEFQDEAFTATAVYGSKDQNTIFYEKTEGENVYLYRYQVQNLLITLNIRNDKIADITNIVKKSTFSIPLLNQTNILSSLKERKIYAGYLGKRVAIIIPNEKIYIIDDNGNIKAIPNYTPKSDDKILWSPDDEYLIIGNSSELLSVSVDSNTLNLVQRVSQNDRIEAEFAYTNGIVYKVISSTSIDLKESNFVGNTQRNIEIPNLDGIRRNNLNKAYDLIEKQNSILIQTSKNIYLFNLSNFELKKFNRFDNEEVILVDPKWEIVITQNTQTKNQFRYYNIDTNDSRTFQLENIDETKNFQTILSYNYSQNLAFNYENLVTFTDSDGSNRIQYQSEQKPEAVMTVKSDRNVLLALSEVNDGEDKLQNVYKVKIERFEN